MIKAQVWDTRRCWVGEGPASSGPGNNSVTWVDILNGKILAKDLATEKTSEHLTGEMSGLQSHEPKVAMSLVLIQDHHFATLMARYIHSPIG